VRDIRSILFVDTQLRPSSQPCGFAQTMHCVLNGVLDSSGNIDTHIEFTEQICPKHSIKFFPTQQLRQVEILTCTPSNFSQNSARSTTVATRGLICFHVSGALCTCWLLQERVCNRRMGISGGFHGLAAVVSLTDIFYACTKR
jgi:hypothetical protein